MLCKLAVQRAVCRAKVHSIVQVFTGLIVLLLHDSLDSDDCVQVHRRPQTHVQ